MVVRENRFVFSRLLFFEGDSNAFELSFLPLLPHQRSSRRIKPEMNGTLTPPITADSATTSSYPAPGPTYKCVFLFDEAKEGAKEERDV